jgi:hypothetical protein
MTVKALPVVELGRFENRLDESFSIRVDDSGAGALYVGVRNEYDRESAGVAPLAALREPVENAGLATDDLRGRDQLKSIEGS